MRGSRRHGRDQEGHPVRRHAAPVGRQGDGHRGRGKGSSKTTVLAIVGGTGPYAGAGGTFTTVDHGKTTGFTLTFK